MQLRRFQEGFEFGTGSSHDVAELDTAKVAHPVL